jgi:outer membrane protein OmpA-like peptidoglycan-associated protein
MGGRDEATTMAPAPTPAVEPAPLPAPVAEPAPAALPIAKFYFEVDQSELPVAREGSLESVIDYLKANPTAVATVSGYHDPTGDAAYNEELAKNRAMTVRNAMLAAGVPESQIDMVKPIVTTGGGDLAEARRVEVAIRP